MGNLWIKASGNIPNSPSGFWDGTISTCSFSLSCRALNTSQLKALNIEMLPGYRDPYSSRPLTRGEIGCFLSHYSVWKEVNNAVFRHAALSWGGKSVGLCRWVRARPVTVLELRLEVAAVVASCLPLRWGQQQIRRANLGATWDDGGRRYPSSGGHTPIDAFLSLVGMPYSYLACLHLLNDFIQEVTQKSWELGQEGWGHFTQEEINMLSRREVAGAGLKPIPYTLDINGVPLEPRLPD